MSTFVWTIPPAVTPTATSAVPATSIDVVANALARVRSQFRDKPLIAAFLESLLTGFQDVETAAAQLRDERSVDTATGVTLTMLGTIVGEPRAGAADDDYRRRIRARIAINRSDGTADAILKVVRAMIDDADAVLVAINYGLGDASITVTEVAVPAATATAAAAGMREATAAGIGIDLIASASVPASTFMFDVPGHTFDVAHFADAF